MDKMNANPRPQREQVRGRGRGSGGPRFQRANSRGRGGGGGEMGHGFGRGYQQNYRPQYQGPPRNHNDGQPPRNHNDGQPPRNHNDGPPPRNHNDGQPRHHNDAGRFHGENGQEQKQAYESRHNAENVRQGAANHDPRPAAENQGVIQNGNKPNARLLFGYSISQGSRTVVHLNDGRAMDSIFRTVKEDGSQVLVSAVNYLEGAEGSNETVPNLDQLKRDVIINSDDIIHMSTRDVDIEAATRATDRGFLDGDISASTNGVQDGPKLKQLQPFQFDGNEEMGGFGLDDDSYGMDGTIWSPEEMLNKNASMGVESSYDESMSQYTIPVPAADKLPQGAHEEAERIAQSINMDPTSRRNRALEDDPAGGDEEMRYSAVYRESGDSTNKYVPPQRRGLSGRGRTSHPSPSQSPLTVPKKDQAEESQQTKHKGPEQRRPSPDANKPNIAASNITEEKAGTGGPPSVLESSVPAHVDPTQHVSVSVKHHRTGVPTTDQPHVAVDQRPRHDQDKNLKDLKEFKEKFNLDLGTLNAASAKPQLTESASAENVTEVSAPGVRRKESGSPVQQPARKMSNPNLTTQVHRKMSQPNTDQPSGMMQNGARRKSPTEMQQNGQRRNNGGNPRRSSPQRLDRKSPIAGRGHHQDVHQQQMHMQAQAQVAQLMMTQARMATMAQQGQMQTDGQLIMQQPQGINNEQRFSANTNMPGRSHHPVMVPNQAVLGSMVPMLQNQPGQNAHIQNMMRQPQPQGFQNELQGHQPSLMGPHPGNQANAQGPQYTQSGPHQIQQGPPSAPHQMQVYQNQTQMGVGQPMGQQAMMHAQLSNSGHMQQWKHGISMPQGQGPPMHNHMLHQDNQHMMPEQLHIQQMPPLLQQMPQPQGPTGRVGDDRLSEIKSPPGSSTLNVDAPEFVPRAQQPPSTPENNSPSPTMSLTSNQSVPQQSVPQQAQFIRPPPTQQQGQRQASDVYQGHPLITGSIPQQPSMYFAAAAAANYPNPNSHGHGQVYQQIIDTFANGQTQGIYAPGPVAYSSQSAMAGQMAGPIVYGGAYLQQGQLPPLALNYAAHPVPSATNVTPTTHGHTHQGLNNSANRGNQVITFVPAPGLAQQTMLQSGGSQQQGYP